MGNRIPAFKKKPKISTNGVSKPTYDSYTSQKNAMNRAYRDKLIQEKKSDPSAVTLVDSFHSKDESLVEAMNKIMISSVDSSQKFSPRYTSSEAEKQNRTQNFDKFTGIKTSHIIDLLNGKDINVKGLTEEHKNIIKKYVDIPHKVNLDFKKDAVE